MSNSESTTPSSTIATDGSGSIIVTDYSDTTCTTQTDTTTRTTTCTPSGDVTGDTVAIKAAACGTSALNFGSNYAVQT